MTRQLVSAFPSIELELHPTSKVRVMDVPQQVETSQSPAQSGEGFGQAVGRGATGETPQDNVGWSRSVMQRGGQANQLIPLFTDNRRINRASDHVIQAAIALGTVQFVELLFSDIESGHQRETQEMTKTKELIGEAMLVHNGWDRSPSLPPSSPVSPG